MRPPQSVLGHLPQRAFANRNDDDGKGPRKKSDLEIFEEQKRNKLGKDKGLKASEKEMEGVETKPKRKRRTKAEIEAEKAAKLAEKSKPIVAEEA